MTAGLDYIERNLAGAEPVEEAAPSDSSPGLDFIEGGLRQIRAAKAVDVVKQAPVGGPSYIAAGVEGALERDKQIKDWIASNVSAAAKAALQVGRAKAGGPPITDEEIAQLPHLVPPRQTGFPAELQPEIEAERQRQQAMTEQRVGKAVTPENITEQDMRRAVGQPKPTGPIPESEFARAIKTDTAKLDPNSPENMARSQRESDYFRGYYSDNPAMESILEAGSNFKNAFMAGALDIVRGVPEGYLALSEASELDQWQSMNPDATDAQIASKKDELRRGRQSIRSKVGLAWLDLAIESLRSNAGGKAAAVGEFLGQLAPSVAGGYAPKLIPIVVSSFGAKTLADEYDKSGDIDTAIGLGALEAGTEYLGLHATVKIGGRIAKRVGQALTGKSSVAEGAKAVAEWVLQAGIEGTEEEVNLVGAELWKAMRGRQSYAEAWDAIRKESLRTFLLGSAGGLIVGAGATYGQFASRKEIIDALVEDGVSPELASNMVDALEDAHAELQKAEKHAAKLLKKQEVPRGTRDAQEVQEPPAGPLPAEQRQPVERPAEEEAAGRVAQRGREGPQGETQVQKVEPPAPPAPSPPQGAVVQPPSPAAPLAEVTREDIQKEADIHDAELEPGERAEIVDDMVALRNFDAAVRAATGRLPRTFFTWIDDDLYRLLHIEPPQRRGVLEKDSGEPAPATYSSDRFRLGMEYFYPSLRLAEENWDEIRKTLAKSVLKAHLEAKGLDPEGVLGPYSGLTELGKRNTIASATAEAAAILSRIRGAFDALKARFTAEPSPVVPSPLQLPAPSAPAAPPAPAAEQKQPWQMTRAEFEKQTASARKINRVLQELAGRTSRENAVRDVADSLSGTPPAEVVDTFRRQTEPSLPNALKQNIARYIFRLYETELGDALTTDAAGKPIKTVDSFYDLLDDLGNDVADLDTQEQGVMAILAIANDAVSRGKPIRPESVRQMIEEFVGPQPVSEPEGEATTHRKIVAEAYARGELIPAEVLAEYGLPAPPAVVSRQPAAGTQLGLLGERFQGGVTRGATKPLIETRPETSPLIEQAKAEQAAKPEDLPGQLTLEPGTYPAEQKLTKASIRETVAKEFPELAVGSRDPSKTMGRSIEDRVDEFTAWVAEHPEQYGQKDYHRLLAHAYKLDAMNELGKIVGLRAGDMQVGDTFDLDGEEGVVEANEGGQVRIRVGDLGQFTVAADDVVPASAGTFDRAGVKPHPAYTGPAAPQPSTLWQATAKAKGQPIEWRRPGGAVVRVRRFRKKGVMQSRFVAILGGEKFQATTLARAQSWADKRVAPPPKAGEPGFVEAEADRLIAEAGAKAPAAEETPEQPEEGGQEQAMPAPRSATAVPPGKPKAPTPGSLTPGWTQPIPAQVERAARLRKEPQDKPKQVRQDIEAARIRRDRSREDPVIDNINEIVQALDRQISAGTPSRAIGRKMRGKKLGYYNPKTLGIRLRRPGFVPSNVHETGHHLHNVLFERRKSVKEGQEQRPAREDFPPAWRNELLALGKALYGEKQPVGGYTAEGWAEVVRLLIQDPATAKQLAPTVYADAVALLSQEHPHIWASMTLAKIKLRNYENLALRNPVAGIVQRGRRQGPRHLRDFIDSIRIRLFDYTQRVRTVMRELGAKPVPEKDPHIAAKRAVSHHAGDVAAMVNYTWKMGDPEQQTGPGLKTILEPVAESGLFEEFEDYLVARRIIEKRGQGFTVAAEDPRLPPRRSNEQLEAYIRRVEAEHPDWGDYDRKRGPKETETLPDGRTRQVGTEDPKTISAKLRSFNKWLITEYAVHHGLLTPEVAKLIHKMNLEYITFREVTETSGLVRSRLVKASRGGGKTITGRGTGIRRFKDVDQIMPPLDQYIGNILGIVDNAIYNDVATMLFENDVLQGAANWFVERQAPMTGMRVGGKRLSQNVLKQLGIKIDSEGNMVLPEHLQSAEPATVQQMVEALSSLQDATFWKRGGRVDRANMEVSYLKNGRPAYYQIKDQRLFDFLEGLGSPAAVVPGLKWLNWFQRTLRAGATEKNPSFGIPNLFRDMFQALTMTETQLHSLPTQARLRAQGFRAAFFGGKIADLYLHSGAAMSGIFGEFYDPKTGGPAMLKMFEKTHWGGAFKGNEKAAIANDLLRLRALGRLNSAFEQQTRMGEFWTVYQTEIQKGTPKQRALVIAGQAAADITLDFQSGGTWGKTWNQYVPFLNAGLLSLDRQYRFYTTMRPHKIAGRILSTIILTTVAELALVWDDDDYWGIPWYRRVRYWHYPMGKDDRGLSRYLTIPKPYGLGLWAWIMEQGVAATIGRDPQTGKSKSGDPQAGKDFIRGMVAELLPSINIALIMPLIEAFAGPRGWSLHFEKYIVPASESRLPAGEQGAIYSSDLARNLGRLSGGLEEKTGLPAMPPSKIDYLIRAIGGDLPKDIIGTFIDPVIRTVDPEARKQPPIEWEDYLIVRRFVARSRPSQHAAIDRFYNQLDWLQKIHAAHKRSEDEPARQRAYAKDHQTELAMYPIYAKASRSMSKDMTEVRKLYRRRETLDPDYLDGEVHRLWKQIIDTARDAYKDTAADRSKK